MYLIVEDNPNSNGDERVFATSGPKKIVDRVQLDRKDLGSIWCDVIGIEENGAPIDAIAQQVEDSSDGIAWLIAGGAWGLRLKKSDASTAWDLKDTSQWGLPFLVLDSGGKEIQFRKDRQQ